MLAADEVVDHAGAERTWSVQSNGGDDVFETIRFEPAEKLLHA